MNTTLKGLVVSVACFLKDAHSAPAAEFRSGCFAKFLPGAKPSNFAKNTLLKNNLPKRKYIKKLYV
jgi:hypothetical protein